ncbi:MAG: OmpH family outer membrane protein [Candidatus Gastranaerophilaceae bacterium]|jgi:outer membrane protein
MNKLKIAAVAVAVTVVVVGGLATFAQQTPIIGSNIGFIDEVAVLKSYPPAQILDEKQKVSTSELQKFVADAKFQIASANTNEKKKQLEESLTSQLNQKKKTLNEEYGKMFSSLQKEIFAVVKTTAKKKNLAIVLRRTSVIYGGTDVTQDVITGLNQK